MAGKPKQDLKTPEVLAPVWPQGLRAEVTALEKVVGELCAASGWSLEFHGASRANVKNRTLSFELSGGAGSNSDGEFVHPFYIDQTTGKMHLGVVNGATIPELGGSPIGEDGNSLTLTGNYYVYIEVDFALTFGTSFFLTAAELSTATIVTSSTPLAFKDLSGSTLTTRRLIAQVIDGTVQRRQTGWTNYNILVCDAGDGTEGGQDANATWNAVETV